MARPRKIGMGGSSAQASIDGTGADVPPAAVNPAPGLISVERATEAIKAEFDPGPMEMRASADPVVVEAAAMARLRVMSNYAFYTDEGAFKAWPEGVIVTDPEEIELLTGRKAPVERIEQ